MNDTSLRNEQNRDSYLARLRARLSYANVAATLALFFALTGTATAAVVLPRDSVGAEQIQADAVRSPEIQADAVRSSEILDESIALADLAPGARSALDAPRVRVDDPEDFLRSVPHCFDLRDCSNLMAVHLPAGRWLVQAKLAVLDEFPNLGTVCGLVQTDTTIIDEAPYIGSGLEEYQTSEQVGLTAVLTTAAEAESTTVAVRCQESDSDVQMYWDSGKLTAVEVKAEAQTDESSATSRPPRSGDRGGDAQHADQVLARVERSAA